MKKDPTIKNEIKDAPKTGEWGFMRPEVDPSKCIGCESCVPFCPDACIEMRKRSKEEIEKSNEVSKEKMIADMDLDFCKGCGVCPTVCPTKAITMKKKTQR